MAWRHISDADLERYYLGMFKAESELAPLEEHLMACAELAEEVQDRVDLIRAAIIKGGHDLK